MAADDVTGITVAVHHNTSVHGTAMMSARFNERDLFAFLFPRGRQHLRSRGRLYLAAESGPFYRHHAGRACVCSPCMQRLREARAKSEIARAIIDGAHFTVVDADSDTHAHTDTTPQPQSQSSTTVVDVRAQTPLSMLKSLTSLTSPTAHTLPFKAQHALTSPLSFSLSSLKALSMCQRCLDHCYHSNVPHLRGGRVGSAVMTLHSEDESARALERYDLLAAFHRTQLPVAEADAFISALPQERVNRAHAALTRDEILEIIAPARIHTSGLVDQTKLAGDVEKKTNNVGTIDGNANDTSSANSGEAGNEPGSASGADSETLATTLALTCTSIAAATDADADADAELVYDFERFRDCVNNYRSLCIDDLSEMFPRVTSSTKLQHRSQTIPAFQSKLTTALLNNGDRASGGVKKMADHQAIAVQERLLHRHTHALIETGDVSGLTENVRLVRQGALESNQSLGWNATTRISK